MWLIVAFDVKTQTPEQVKSYSQFRKKLIQKGFVMMQYSVYLRHFTTYQKAKAQAARIQYTVPDNGKVSCLFLTDKQYGMTINFYGKNKDSEAILKKPEQLLLL